MSEPDAVRRHVWVSGRVQGVWFREGCRRRARALGVGGWVRNLPDGRVEAVFEGARPAVEACVEWCRTGPAGARVDALEALEELAAGTSGFQVR